MAAEGDVAPVEGAVAATLEDLAMVGGSVEFQYGGATITLGELGMAGTGVPASATGAVVKYLEDVVMAATGTPAVALGAVDSTLGELTLYSEYAGVQIPYIVVRFWKRTA
jgi:hypothetical protein